MLADVVPTVATSAVSGSTVPRQAGRGLAAAACVVGLLYAAVSAYWGAGGGWLLDTVGRSVAQGHVGAVGIVVVWAAVGLKLVAAFVPLVASRPRPARAIRALAWLEAAVLTGYGLVLTSVGLLVQAAVVPVATTADHRALAWHAYLWDPWFLAWGLLVAGSLLLRLKGSKPW